MELSDINGMKVKLEVLDGEYKTEYESEYYLSEIVDIDLDNKVKLALPIVMKAYMVFSNNTKINIYYAHNDVRKPSLYIIPCVVKGIDKYSRPPSIIVDVCGDMVKRQRRNFFRVPCASDSNEVIVGGCSQGESIKVCDISAMGVRLKSDKKMERDCELEIIVSYTNNDVVIVKGRVVRSRLIDTGVAEGYDVGVEFYDIDKSTHEILNKYIMEKQRQLLVKTKK